MTNKTERIQFNLRLSDELKKKLEKQSEKLGMSQNSYILMLLHNAGKKEVI